MNTFLRLILILVLGFSSITSTAQPMLAKIKYEEAEQAYQNKDYKTALKLIEEVEKIYNGTSPKTLYLKIFSLKESGDTDFKTTQKLRSYCNFFLEKYAENSDVEDRYRDVYAFSKTLNNFPKTEEEYEIVAKKRRQKLIEIEERKKQEGLKEEKMKQIQAFPFDYGLNPGMNLKVAMDKVPTYVWKNFTDYGANGGKQLLKIQSKGMKYRSVLGFNGISIDVATEDIHTLFKTHVSGGKSDFKFAFNKLKELENKMVGIFGRENVIYEKKDDLNIIVKLADHYPIRISLLLTRIDFGALIGSNVELLEIRESK
jgi:hypothetical protein